MSLTTINGSDINNISDEIKQYLEDRQLKPGEEAKYRLLNGTKNTDKERRDGEILYPSSVGIPLTDKIYDPGANKGKGGLVTIGVIREVDRDGNVQFKKLYVTPRKNEGTFSLRGNVVADLEMYEVIELLSKNKSNKFRAEGSDELFERVDEGLEAQARSRRRNILRDSLNAIQKWTYEEARIIGAAYNIPSTLPHDVIKDRLETIAEKDPVSFYKTIDNEETKVKAIISLAKEKGILSYNGHEHKWIMTGSGETLAILTRSEGVSETDQFAQVLLNGANGPKIRGNIEKLLKAK